MTMSLQFLSGLDVSRRREILSAVAQVLIDKRRRAVEMQEVLEQSGMLFDDVAAEFSDLDDVLLSLVRCVSGWICEPIGLRAGHPTSRDNLLEGLTEFGRRYTQANATILPGIFRVFLTEGSRRSQLQHTFYADGPKAISDALTGFLDRTRTNAISTSPQSHLVAEALMGMLREPLYRELAIHSKEMSSALSSVDSASDIVRMFVAGCIKESER